MAIDLYRDLFVTRFMTCSYLGGGFNSFSFSPLPGVSWSNLTNMFQMGWFNHQLFYGEKTGTRAFAPLFLRPWTNSPASTWWWVEPNGNFFGRCDLEGLCLWYLCILYAYTIFLGLCIWRYVIKVFKSHIRSMCTQMYETSTIWTNHLNHKEMKG